MTTMYYYICAGRVLDETARFFQVAVGTTRQATRDYLALVAHAVDHGHYFELRSRDTIDFVSRCLDSMKHCKPAPILQRVTARELIRNLRASTAPPLSANVLANRHHLNYWMNVDYRCKR